MICDTITKRHFHGDVNGLFDDKKPFVTLRETIGDLEENTGDYFEGDYSTIYMSRNRKKVGKTNHLQANWECGSYLVSKSYGTTNLRFHI